MGNPENERKKFSLSSAKPAKEAAELKREGFLGRFG